MVGGWGTNRLRWVGGKRKGKAVMQGAGTPCARGEEGGAMMLKNWITVCLFAQNSNSPPQSATLDSGYAISRCVGRQALRKARQTISAAATWKDGGWGGVGSH